MCLSRKNYSYYLYWLAHCYVSQSWCVNHNDHFYEGQCYECDGDKDSEDRGKQLVNMNQLGHLAYLARACALANVQQHYKPTNNIFNTRATTFG